MPKKGESATQAQRDALKRGAAKRAKALANANPEDDTQGERWKKLLDGRLTVEDLTDDEVARMRVHGKGGVFFGSAKRLPSNLIAAFYSEQIKRAKSTLTKDLQKAAQMLGKVIDDPEAKDSDKLKAAALLLDRVLGKTPETVNIKTTDPWGDMLQAGAQISDVRDLSGLAPDDLASLNDA